MAFVLLLGREFAERIGSKYDLVLCNWGKIQFDFHSMFVSLRKFNIPLSVMEQTSLSERLPAQVQEYYLGWTCCFFFFFF